MVVHKYYKMSFLWTAMVHIFCENVSNIVNLVSAWYRPTTTKTYASENFEITSRSDHGGRKLNTAFIQCQIYHFMRFISKIKGLLSHNCEKSLASCINALPDKLHTFQGYSCRLQTGNLFYNDLHRHLILKAATLSVPHTQRGCQPYTISKWADFVSINTTISVSVYIQATHNSTVTEIENGWVCSGLKANESTYLAVHFLLWKWIIAILGVNKETLQHMQ